MPDTQREFWAAINTELAMGNYGAAQTWTALESYTLTEVWLRMANSFPAYNGTLTLDLYSVSGGEPDAKIATLWSGSVNSWGSVQSWRFLTGISQAITNGVIYAYVVTLNPLRDATHYIRWSGKSGYAGGVGYQENTDGVYTNALIDWHFVNYGTDAPALPGKPINPTPTDAASDVTLHSTTGTWESGGDTDSYNVYYGTLSGFLELVEEGVTDLSLPLVEGQFSVYGKISYWRIDAVNENGTTQGDEWVFTTMLFAPPLPTGYSLDYGEDPPVLTGTPTGESNMMTVRKLVVAANNKIWYEDI